MVSSNKNIINIIIKYIIIKMLTIESKVILGMYIITSKGGRVSSPHRVCWF